MCCVVRLAVMMVLATAFVAPATWAAEAASPLKVGVYRRATGGAAMAKALAKVPGLQVIPFKEFTTDSLLACDAVVIGACTLDRPEQVKATRTYLASGGGLVLQHSACGRGRPETPVPSVARKVIDRRPDTVLAVKDRAHPIAAELPDQFEHAYHDHLFLEPGPDGTVVVADREGAAVVVAGNAGAGRIVMCGALPGYRYDPATFAQAEAEPTGGELQLAVNMAKWAAAGRLTAQPPEQIAERRKKAESDLKLEDLSRLLPTSDWFGTEMLRGSYLPLQPVNELGGRFFITYDSQTWRGYQLKRIDTPAQLEFYRNRVRLDVCQLKWLGVTDIVYWTDVSGERVHHPTAVPDSDVQCRGFDPLAELIQAATAEGLHVWASWHSCIRSEKFAQKYAARDAEGNFYKYGGEDYCEDLLSPAYRQRCHALLDEYAAKYKPLGNFPGLAIYDELWFTYADFHGDDLPRFEQFCTQRFGEELPADMAARLTKRTAWTDTDDVWRRRYILFKQQVVSDFWRDLVEYAHGKGLKIGVQLLSTANYPTGWSWGIDSVALARLGADFYNGSAGAYENMLRWAHVHDTWGQYNTACFHGGPGGIYFTFNQLWRLVMYGNNPALPRELGRHIHQQRSWAGAQSLARVALLHNQNALQMLLPDTRPQANRETALLRALQRRQHVETIFTQADERYHEFGVLIATPYAVRGLSADARGKLRRFVEDGGTIISLNADWSVAREDLTEERDVTAEMAGMIYGETLPVAPATFRAGDVQVSLPIDTPRRRVTPAPDTKVLAQFGDGSPVVTERTLGKGKVIGVHFGADVELEKNDNPALVAYLAGLVQQASRPAVVAEGSGFRVISTLKKGNWVAVALFPDMVPCQARLSVDLEALGIRKGRFRMLMLGKQMEIGRPGDLWGESGFWTAAGLKAGFPVTIAASDDRNLPLPETFDLSDFQGERGRTSADYLQTVTRDWWDNETRGRRKRTYAYEIVVLAPGDEPLMPKDVPH